jgi:hypothetical protein
MMQSLPRSSAWLYMKEDDQEEERPEEDSLDEDGAFYIDCSIHHRYRD